jgi:signal transduction histidine kinase/HPt (histidine-containing phosphotransfer) domain-containing protein/FixJ family two-component response regulator
MSLPEILARTGKLAGSRLGLRGKLLCALVIGCLVALVPATLVGWNAIKTARERFGLDYASNLTLLNSYKIFAPISRELALSRRFAGSEITRSWLLDEEDSERRALFFKEAESFRRDFQDHSWFVVVDKSRHSYFQDEKDHTGTEPVETYTPENNAWYFATLGNTDDVSVNVDYEPAVDVTKVWFNVVVKDGDRKIGIAGTGLDLAVFLREFVAGDTASATPMILNRDGYIQAHPDRHRIALNSSSGAAPSQPSLLAQLSDRRSRDALQAAMRAAEERPGTVATASILLDGKRQLAALTYIPELQWHVMSAVDLTAARLFDSRWYPTLIVALLLLLALLVVGFGYAVENLALRPLRRLQHSARAIAEGRYDIALPPPTADELGELTRAFSTMAEQVRQHTEELESKVRERTRDLVAARDEAQATDRAKRDFLANMSHEIRTPVNAIAGFTALALRTDLDGQQRGYLERVHDASRGLLRVINDVLDISKIEAGHLEMEHIPFRLGEVVDSVMGYIRTLAETKGLALLVSVSPAVPAQLIGDPFRLGQILSNLCGNAVKFTERGEVELRVEVESRSAGTVRLLFAVRDTGIGLADAEAAKLFQPFSQADSSTTRRFGGTGLGLAISQRLVALMTGSIWLESKQGVGTTFFVRIELPAAVGEPAAAASRTMRAGASLARRGPARLRGVRLLLVEDNPINQELAAELLEQEGARVEIAGSGIAALEKLGELGVAGFDAALVDLQMPEMDGFETVRRIRMLPGAEHLPLLAMTAHAMVEDRERCLAAGMQDHIAKPIDPDLLAEKLVQWIGPEALARAAAEPLREARSFVRPAVETGLPDRLPGIDVPAALAQCGGDAVLYHDLLGKFGRHYGSAASDLRRLCDAGKSAEAHHFAHNIKGVAANLGMYDLAAAAAALELALEECGREPSDVR